ncbi:alpha-hydroxy acid oxidase [Streptomyces sp. NPDC090994]|uniref:alpha-hydroxy acid oxidase n=1 Tax=Streptomyces sp. NPDC090994 TaxID=3365969 RepID=UPI003825FD23
MAPTTDAGSVADLEPAARERLAGDIWDFIAGGSGDETTLAANRAALDRITLVPRVLRDLSERHTRCELFGFRASVPAAVAPLAYHRLVHPDGEAATARAARRAGVPLTVSTMSSTSLEQVTDAGGTVWFQLYPLRDRQRTRALVRRAEDARCAALMVTVDVPWMARRPRDIRNSFSLPPHVRAPLLGDEDGAPDARSRVPHASAVAEHTRASFAPFTWADLAELRRATSLPLIVKGVLAPDDAVRAVEAGADGVVVSNHGGRQLDGAIPTADALGAVCEAVGGRGTVLFDSGVRSGTDVLRALACGADAVLVGRPVLWGLAVGGEAGVHRVLTLLRREFSDALGLAGCPDPAAARELAIWRRPA